MQPWPRNSGSKARAASKQAAAAAASRPAGTTIGSVVPRRTCDGAKGRTGWEKDWLAGQGRLSRRSATERRAMGDGAWGVGVELELVRRRRAASNCVGHRQAAGPDHQPDGAQPLACCRPFNRPLDVLRSPSHALARPHSALGPSLDS